MHFSRFTLRVGGLSLVIIFTLGIITSWSQPLRLPFTVDTTADTVDAAIGNGVCADANGDCSLRAAISEANATDAADIITLPAGEYALTITGDIEDLNLTGDLDIRSSLTIQGDDAATTIITTSINIVDALIDIEASAITIDVTIDNVTISHSIEPDRYGLEVTSNLTTLNLTNSIVSNNYTGLVSGDDTNIIVTDSEFINNVGGLGGGIWSGGNLSVYRSIFSENEAQVGAGILSTFSNTLIVDSIFTDNTASYGGAIASSGETSIYNSVFTDNLALVGFPGGGALLITSGTASVYSSTFNGNKASYGGAISNRGILLNLYNSTFSGNSTYTEAGSVGGAIYNESSDLNLNNVTITANNSPEGGGLYISSEFADINIANSIIAGNFAALGADCSDPESAITSGGHNLIGNTNNCLQFTASGDQVNVSASLDPLNNNGGFTQTHALQSGSLAINAGNAATCIGYDQRYFPRVGICDIGAYEADAPTTTVTPTVDAPTPTVTPTLDPETQVQLIENGGFEILNADQKPVISPWVIKFGTSEKAKCNKLDKVISHTGNCAFVFKGAPGENSKLEQTITSDEDFNIGETLDFSAFVKGGNTPNVKVKVRVKYTDSSDTGKINLEVASGSDYVEIADDYVLDSAAVNKIKVQFGNKGTSGKVYIDDVSLIYTSASAASLLPLP